MKLSSDLRALVKEFRPGYRIEPIPNRVARYAVVTDDNEIVFNPDGTPLVLGKAETPKSLRRVRGQLEAAGVIERTRKRSDRERHEPIRVHRPSNPILLSQEVMADPHSTPRERKLAKEYLNIVETHDRVLRLARHLGERVREYEQEKEAAVV